MTVIVNVLLDDEAPAEQELVCRRCERGLEALPVESDGEPQMARCPGCGRTLDVHEAAEAAGAHHVLRRLRDRVDDVVAEVLEVPPAPGFVFRSDLHG